MTRYDTVLRAGRLVTSGRQQAGWVGVTDGRIAAVEPLEAGLAGRRVVELGDDVVLLPGLVDAHVHVDEPGRTQWEGFASATRAAAAGGVTTILDMPLNSIPPTVDVAALEVERKSALGQCFVDVGFRGGAVPGNLGDLTALHAGGVFGFTCFLVHSGVDEFPPLRPEDLEDYLRVLRTVDGLLLVHAEDGDAIEQAPSVHSDDYGDFLSSRPRGAEDRAIRRVIDAARATGARTHILHHSSTDALPLIAAARRDGVRITAETCSGDWTELLPRTRLQPDTRHLFRLPDVGEVDTVRLDVFPDGGMARVRLHGALGDRRWAQLGLRWFNSLPSTQARQVLGQECGPDGGAVDDVLAGRPVPDPSVLPGAVRSLLTGGAR
ncbi:amidohydrolase family protein [Geodermatophilus sp. URMC 60]